MDDLNPTVQEDRANSTSVHVNPACETRVPLAHAWRPRLRRLRRITRSLAQAAADNSRVAARAADKQVHASPWRFIAVAGLAALAIGYAARYSRSHVEKSPVGS